MSIKLSTGVLQRILNGEVVDKPVLQLLGYKKIPGGADRYRLLLSDGQYSYGVSMLATQLNERLVQGDFEKFTVVRLDKYIVNQVQPDKRVVILLELSVIVSHHAISEKIGDPINLDVKDAVAGANANQHGQRRNNTGAQGYKNGSAVGGLNNSLANEVPVNVHPINSLTPYQNKWTIRARVTNKTPIKTWSNSRGEGKLFSMDLLDESGEIRATGFNDQCDKFFNTIEINQVYFISKANLKTANKQYSSIRNDYEMTLNSESTVIPCNDNIEKIPMLQFHFIQISKIQNVDKDDVVDVIGICKSSSDILTFMAKTTNKEMKKRDVILVDKSCTEINLTLWSAEAEKFDGSMNPVVVVKGARVSDYGGRSLSVLSSSVLQINPDIHDAHVLRGWYDREGSSLQTQSITVKGSGLNTNWKTFSKAKEENLGVGEKPDYYNTKASVTMVKRDNCLYQACPTADCNKKVVDMNNGLYRCEKCNREFDSFKWRLILSISLSDFSDHQWVSCFQESAEIIVGMTAQELGNLKQEDEERFNEVMGNANFKSYIFKLRTKVEMYNDESRVKTVVFSATPLNSLEYARKLLIDIKNLESVV